MGMDVILVIYLLFIADSLSIQQKIQHVTYLNYFIEYLNNLFNDFIIDWIIYKNVRISTQAHTKKWLQK